MPRVVKHLLPALLLGLLVLPAIVRAQDDKRLIDDSRSAEENMSRRIDELLREVWQTAGRTPAQPCNDDEFLRRVYLDLTGAIPPVSEVRQFRNDPDPDKRRKMIDKLLTSAGHASHLAATWRRVLLPRGFEADELDNAVGLENWLRRQFVDNLRYDNLVADFLVAQGDGRSGPALYYASLEVKPEKLASSTASIFLGLQIQCAECHNHPFDHWTQRDFWGYAAFFAQLGPPVEQPGQPFRLVDLPQGDVTLPDTEEVIAPQFPGGDAAPTDDIGSRRSRLAVWMASRDNPYLPRAAVNWAWSHLFGRGLVHPIDDHGPNNPPSHPQLLNELTEYFIQQNFDLRVLLRTLANTQAYQLTSQVEGEAPPDHLFARMLPKTLTSEQLYDSMHRAAAMPYVETMMAAGPSNRLRDPQRLAFVSAMQLPSRDAADYEAGLPQALLLMNGPLMDAAVDPQRSGILQALRAPFFDDHSRVETLFLATLGRAPREEELALCLEQLTDTQQRDAVLSDILWSLLNSAEFAVNH